MSFYQEYAIYSICGSLGTDIMPKWNKSTFLCVSWRQLCRLLTSSRHTGVRSLLVSYGDSNVWPGGLLQAIVIFGLYKEYRYRNNAKMARTGRFIGRELSLLKMAIDMANADYLSFFLWTTCSYKCDMKSIFEKYQVEKYSIRSEGENHRTFLIRARRRRYWAMSIKFHKYDSHDFYHPF